MRLFGREANEWTRNREIDVEEVSSKFDQVR